MPNLCFDYQIYSQLGRIGPLNGVTPEGPPGAMTPPANIANSTNPTAFLHWLDWPLPGVDIGLVGLAVDSQSNQLRWRRWIDRHPATGTISRT